MPNPKYSLSDIMRHVREFQRCIIVLEARIRELERQNEDYEWFDQEEE